MTKREVERLENTSIKKRIVLGVDSSAMNIVNQIIKVDGIGGLFLGWQANLVKDVPFAALKLTLYEGVWQLYANYLPKEEKYFIMCQIMG